MTAAPIQNHYKVLRIERTADERAVKKAYFTLIREFPPDTHPEEFKSIREAYEVLSDKVARERYDNLDKDYAEYGDEVSFALKAVEEAEKANAEPEVQRMLLELIESHPDLLFAREKLALSYLRADAFDKALGALDALLEREPENALYHLRRGVALHRLEKPEEAEKALKKAYELKPDDLDVALSYIKFLSAIDKPKKALKIVDKTIALHAEGTPPNVILRLRRVHVLLLSAGNDAAQEEINALFEKARELNDPELFKFISSQLATIAAGLFGRKEPDQANKLLARCVEINPDSLGERPYPPSARFDLEDLPKEGQAWLSRLAPGPQSPTIFRNVWLAPICMILGAIGVTALFYFLAFHEPEAWSTGEAVAAAIPVFACALALGFSARKAAEIISSPLRSFFSIHPLYLVDVALRRVDVYPLFGLTDLQAIHHHTNGAYSHTQITLRFASKTYTASIRGKEFAEGWLGYLLECRQRALELMAEGYLDAEHGIELLPPALLMQKTTAKKRTRALRFYSGVAAVGFAAWAILMPLRGAKVDETAWRKAVRVGTSAAYLGYARAMPEGSHVDEAKRLGKKPFEDAIADFRAATKADAPLAKALIEAATILHEEGETQATVTVTVTNNLPEAARPEPGTGSPLSLSTIGTRSTVLVGQLNAMLAGAGLARVLKLVPIDTWKGMGKPAALVELVIEGDARGDSAVLAGEGAAELPAPLIEWKVKLLKKGAAEPFWSTTLAVPAPEEIPLPASGVNIVNWVCDRAVDAAFRALADKLAREIGLPGAPPSAGGISGALAARRTFAEELEEHSMELKNVRKRDAIILGATLLTAAVGVGAVHWGCSYQDVWLVNGLEQAVEVEIDGDRRKLAPGTRDEVTLRAGVHAVRVLASDGKVIDEEPIDVPSNTDVVAYNVAGATLLYLETIEYKRYPSSTNNDQNGVEIFAGVRLIARDRVSFVFKEPPTQISVKSGESTTRYRFDMAQGGWRTSAGYLQSKSEADKLARLYRAIAIASPGSRDLVDQASEMLELAQGAPAALRFLREMRALRPDDAAVHMEYQYRMQRLGRGEEILTEYKDLLEKNPGSPLYGVLVSRAEPKDQAGARLTELVKSHPSDVQVLSTAAYHAYVTGDYATSVDLYARFQDKPEHERSLAVHLGALVALGKVQEAVDLAGRYASAATTPGARGPLLYALVARLPGASPPEPPMTYVNRMTGTQNAGDWKLFSAAIAGEPVPLSELMSIADPDLRKAIEIHLAAARDPAEAWELCSKAPPNVLRMMSPATAVLLGVEFARAGDADLGERLLERDVGQWLPVEALFSYVRAGEEHANFWRIDPELRAALAFVRARHLASRGEAAADLLAEAENRDLLKGVVARARASWPPVAGPPAAEKKGDKGGKGAKTLILEKIEGGVLRRVPRPAAP